MPRTRGPGGGQLRASPQCIFCGAAPPLTDEHVFGKWLRNLGYTGEGVREYIPRDGSEPILQRGGLFTKKLKIVCASCNGGWMSQLEETAKPLLIRMFSLPYTPYQDPRIALDANDQLALARWAFKTAVIALYVDRVSSFPPAHREQFYRQQRHDPPQHVQIWTGSSVVPNHPDHGEHLVDTDFNPRELTIRESGSTVMQTGFYLSHIRLLNVVFVVMGYIADADAQYGSRVDLSEGLGQALTPLWPPSQRDITWPPPANVDMAALKQSPFFSSWRGP